MQERDINLRRIEKLCETETITIFKTKTELKA